MTEEDDFKNQMVAFYGGMVAERGLSDDKFALIGSLRAQEGRGAEIGEVLNAFSEAAQDEPGTLIYAVHADPQDGDVFWTYELYAGLAGLEAHLGGKTFLGGAPKLMGLLAEAPSPNITRLVSLSTSGQ